jgi:hypothetical protein
MIELGVLIIILILVGGIIYVLKNGFNEIIKGLEAIDERLKDIEDKISKKKSET